MEHFSNEYRDKLVAEHKLVSAAIAHMKAELPAYSRRHEGAAINAALFNLNARKAELEAYIDVLTAYLN